MAGYESDESDCDDELVFFLSSPATSPSGQAKTESVVDDVNDDDDVEGFAQCLATPLVQVFSVCLSTVFDDGKPCEIHGSIRVFEGPDCHNYNLYDRDPEDSEAILESGTLSLVGPYGGAIIPSMMTTLVIQLKDKIHGVDVVNRELKFDLSTQGSYDRLLKGVVHGDYGSVVVSYVVFRFAIYGYVQVTVTKNDNEDNNCNAVDIYGSVVATYDNCRMYCSDEKDVKQLQTRLFYHPSCRPLHVQAGTHISMSRNVVVVPAYSTLAIQVNLWDLNGEIASDGLKFPAYLKSDAPVYIETQYARVKVQIKWKNAYLDQNVWEGRPMVFHDQHLLALLSIGNLPKTKQYYGTYRAEVFTVFVGGISKKVSALCGTISVEDGSSDMMSIFERGESCKELLRDDGLVCIEFNYRAIQNCVLYIVLNLTDPIGKREVSRGYTCFHLGYYQNMFGRRMCAVVPGKDGYAAVHYEVFKNALEAFVKVKLFAANGDLDIPTSLYGTLLASYSGHNYSTSYEKTYYKSRLIDRPLDRAVESKTGSEIALLKSIVVVPASSSLIIEADLGAFGSNNVVQPIDGKAEFEINTRDTKSKIIRGQDYGIEISIKFKD